MLTDIDPADELLKRLRWSTGDDSFVLAQELVWFVYARRDGESIVARAHTQGGAWKAAAEQAMALDKCDC
jgi:hypothetical protein